MNKNCETCFVRIVAPEQRGEACLDCRRIEIVTQDLERRRVEFIKGVRGVDPRLTKVRQR